MLPGAPVQVEFISSDYDSVLLRIALSSEGTAPLTQLEVQFHSPEIHLLNITKPNLFPGHTVEVTLSGLEDGTAYVISFAAYNYGGKGMPSQQIKVTTGEWPCILMSLMQHALWMNSY